MESAKVYRLNRERTTMSPAVPSATAPGSPHKPKLLDQVGMRFARGITVPKQKRAMSTGSNDSFSFTIDAIRSR